MQEWIELNISYWKGIDPSSIRFSYISNKKMLRISLGEEVVEENDLYGNMLRVFSNKHYTQLLLKKAPQKGYRLKKCKNHYTLSLTFPRGILKTQKGCPQEANCYNCEQGLIIDLESIDSNMCHW